MGNNLFALPRGMNTPQLKRTKRDIVAEPAQYQRQAGCGDNNSAATLAVLFVMFIFNQGNYLGDSPVHFACQPRRLAL